MIYTGVVFVLQLIFHNVGAYKEGFACLVGVKRFHSYLFGHHIEQTSDQQLLLALLNHHKSTSFQASVRASRLSFFLCGYEYTMIFRGSKAHGNADALSRLPLPIEENYITRVTDSNIQLQTRKDQILSSMMQLLKNGWPSQSDPNTKPYF